MRTASGPWLRCARTACLLAAAARASAELADAVDTEGAPAVAEAWTAGWVFNYTDTAVPCPVSTDTYPAVFVTARWPVLAPSGSTASPVTANFSFNWPLHSKAVPNGGFRMAEDAVNRVGYAAFTVTDYSAHVYLARIAFPKGKAASSAVTGLCEVINGSTTWGWPFFFNLGFNSLVSRTGPFAFVHGQQWPPAPNVPPVIMGLSFPPGAVPVPGEGDAIPPCITKPLATLAGGGGGVLGNWQGSPLVRGTMSDLTPVLWGVTADTRTNNASQLLFYAWTLKSGAVLHNGTVLACGDPSYAYTCPTPSSTFGEGTEGMYLQRGLMLLGGGAWSAQQYFQAILPVAGSPDLGALVMQALSVTGAQGTWLADSFGSNGFAVTVPKAKGAPGTWPTRVMYVPPGGSCTTPGWASLALLDTYSQGTPLQPPVVNTTLASGTWSPTCPLLPVPWNATEAGNAWACLGNAYGLPDVPPLSF